MKCFYHFDLDGHASGAVVSKKYPECEFYEIDYSIQFPFDIIEKNERIIIVDYSLKKKQFEQLLEITNNIVWCDHHQTAIKELSSFRINGLRTDTYPSGAVITWNYFFPDEDVPRALQYVSDWDTHTLKLDKTKLFYYGTQAFDTSPTSSIWKYLLNDYRHCNILDEIISIGNYIKIATETKYENYVKSYSYEVEFEGLNCIVCNNAMVGSDLFLSIGKKYDLYIVYVHNGKQFRISMYKASNDNVFCNKIAEKYGGGGHPGAAGFTCNNLPWLSEEKNETHR